MFLKLPVVSSKSDDMLKPSSKPSLVKPIRWLIGEAACQMKTAMLFKSPGIILISVRFHQGVKHYAVPYLQGTTLDCHLVRISYQWITTPYKSVQTN